MQLGMVPPGVQLPAIVLTSSCRAEHLTVLTEVWPVCSPMDVLCMLLDLPV